MSVQAKSIPLKHREKVKPKFFHKICGCGPDEEDFPEFTMTLGAHCKEYFMPNEEWNEYRFSCIPETVDGTSMISPGLQLTGKGTAWFDLVQLYPDMDVKSFVNRDNNDITIRITTVHKGTEIFYTLDGSEPTQSSTPFKGNFNIHTSAILKAVTFKDGVMVGYIERPFVISMATGRYVEYKYKYSTKYDAGMKDGLVDGILASSDFKDGRWQGFEGDDLDVVINLKEVKKVNEVILRFHSMQASWIFLPVEIKVLWSADGNEYYEFASSKDKADGVPEEVNKYTYRFQNDVEARYIRIFAKNIGACPEGHSGEGGKAWLFTDEIIIQ